MSKTVFQSDPVQRHDFLVCNIILVVFIWSNMSAGNFHVARLPSFFPDVQQRFPPEEVCQRYISCGSPVRAHVARATLTLLAIHRKFRRTYDHALIRPLTDTVTCPALAAFCSYFMPRLHLEDGWVSTISCRTKAKLNAPSPTRVRCILCHLCATAQDYLVLMVWHVRMVIAPQF